MKKTRSIKKFANLEYLTIVNVPVRRTSHGEVYDISLGELERVAAIEILENQFPIHGQEVKLFRSVMRLSLAAFGNELGYKDTTILNWEKNLEKRLSLANEMAVRVLVGEFLGVPLVASVSALRGRDRVKKLRVSAA